MQHQYLSSSTGLREICQTIREAPAVYYDTEFVSEDTYRPELCLVQVLAGDELAVIDPYSVGDMTPFWESLTEGNHRTVVHAGREEFRFCWHATGNQPRRLFDVQIAAGLIGLEYPASYAKLIQKLLGARLPKGETRTNWRQRPLTARQIEYALLDVHHLPALEAKITEQLDALGRLDWFQAEIDSWQEDLIAAESRENWRRVSGISGLSNRALLFVRELWRWRETEAQATNKPPRRILRDDLIVELARRGKSDLRQIKAIRGIERSGARRHLATIADVITRAAELPPLKQQRRSKPAAPNQVQVLGQFLATALTSICHQKTLAPSIVGTAQDVRDLVAFELGCHPEEEGTPRLAQGWRAEVVGDSLRDLLQGKKAIRIEDPMSEQPLRFDAI